MIEELYRRYVESDSWRCPAGGAHFWVCTNGTKHCIKCSGTRNIVYPDHVWNDNPVTIGVFGIQGTFDVESRLRI